MLESEEITLPKYQRAVGVAYAKVNAPTKKLRAVARAGGTFLHACTCCGTLEPPLLQN